MKISTRTRYGLRAVVCLAQQYGKGPVSVREMAELQSLPTKYLEQLCATLKSAGLLTSVRGASGGYLLARPPDQITLLQVYTALEGSVAPVECLEGERACPEQGSCPTRPVWQRVSDAMEGVLHEQTLADLVTRPLEE